MKANSLFQKENQDIMKSIDLFKKGLMEDMNLTLRLTDNDRTFTTQPVEWVQDLIIFEAPMSQLDYIIYPINTKIQVVFVSKAGLFTTYISISKNYKKNNSLYYVGKIISPIIKKQQRESFRLDVIMDVKYSVLSEDESQIESNEPYQKGSCVNISTGGMCLNCQEQLHSHTHLLLSFTFMDTPLTLHGEILFMGEPTESGTYTHRIKFYNMMKSETNQLNQLIFKKQRSLLKHV